ncbi:MAG: hypothetical protein ACKV2O_09380 [Acidimicrobiales bacterium]
MRALTNRQELGEILRREGINPNAYALEGGHPSERYVIDLRPAGWVVYYSERGLETGRREFDTEAEACRYLLDLLRNDPTTHFHLVVGPLPADDADLAFASWQHDAGLMDINAADVRVDNPVLADGPVRRYWVRGTVLPSR